MQPALLLLLYAFLAGACADRWLATTPWAERAPGAALLAWHATAFSVVGSLLAALYLLAHDVSEHSLASLLHADKGLLHAAYAPPQETAALWNTAALGAIALLLLVTLGVLRGYRSAKRTALQHQIAVTHSQTHTNRGRNRRLGVIDSTFPTVYCVAVGPKSERILITRAALDQLPDRLLSAAIAHEEAHLSRHHHTQLIAARAIHATTYRLGLLRHYPDSVEALVELEADDTAANQHGTRAVAAALLQLGQHTQPARPGDLTMANVNAASRIRRLMHANQSTCQAKRRWRPAASFNVAIAVVAIAALAPLTAALTPALALSGTAPDHQPNPPSITRTGFAHHP